MNARLRNAGVELEWLREDYVTAERRSAWTVANDPGEFSEIDARQAVQDVADRAQSKIVEVCFLCRLID